MSINNFLSISTNRDVSFRFDRGALCNPVLLGFLLVRTIYPASISDISYFTQMVSTGVNTTLNGSVG
jgi:hypothetical protein